MNLDVGDRERLKKKILEAVAANPHLTAACDRCLKTDRWGGSVVLMVVDAALTSSGLNYFDLVVPRVRLFSERFVEGGAVASLQQLAQINVKDFLNLWRNERCWSVAKEVASALKNYGKSDREALRNWASKSVLQKWRLNPIGSIKGVGLVTYQYLRMMGGVDTVMPDRVVKRVLNKMLTECGFSPVRGDLEFIEEATSIAHEAGVRPIELCWMTWLQEGEGEKIRSSRDPEILLKI
ncbi:MAG: hypothetical protein RMJ28_01615 [Nitrososphaerota archaeon]|nr:hypothetical protein [Candidatus Calditenuaceae archaeon]MDW8072922.1 hypothetical protein [Nitrososphaerota archaeon]